MAKVTPITEAKPKRKPAAKRKPKAKSEPTLDEVISPERRAALANDLKALTVAFHRQVSAVGRRYGVNLVETVHFQIET